MTIVAFYLIMQVHMSSPSFALVCGPGAAGHWDWGRMQASGEDADSFPSYWCRQRPVSR